MRSVHNRAKRFLHVEIARCNTDREMRRKLRDYFTAGVELVWLIDRPTRTARAYSAADRFEAIDADGVLDAGEILPGLTVPLPELFQRADEQAGMAEPSPERS